MIWMWLLFAALVIAAVLLGWGRGRRGDEQVRSDAAVADVDTHSEVVREMKTVTLPVARQEQVDVPTRSVALNDVAIYEQELTENREVP